MISIAMTTYNGEKFLCEQFDSILSQIHTDLTDEDVARVIEVVCGK